MRISVGAAWGGECLRVKADMVSFVGNTVLSINDRVRGVCTDALSTYFKLRMNRMRYP